MNKTDKVLIEKQVKGSPNTKRLVTKLLFYRTGIRHISDTELRISMLKNENKVVQDPVYVKLELALNVLAEKYDYFWLDPFPDTDFWENGGSMICSWQSDITNRRMPEYLYRNLSKSRIEEILLMVEGQGVPVRVH